MIAFGSARVYSAAVHTPSPPIISTTESTSCGTVMEPGLRRRVRLRMRKNAIAMPRGIKVGHMKMKSST